MATAPQIEARDGSFTTNLVLTTNAETISFSGTVEANTIDIQISVNGDAFVSDPMLVALDGTEFQIPNPASYPEGLTLNLGVNTYAFRAIDLVGGVSPVSTAQVTRLLQVSEASTLIPTGIRLRRNRTTVLLLAAQPTNIPESLEFRGFNYYASTSESGVSGRYKINVNRVTEATEQESEVNALNTNTAVFSLVTNARTVRTRVTQEDAFGQTLSTVADVVIDVLGETTDLQAVDTLNTYELNTFIGFRHSRTGTSSDNTTNSDQFTDLNDTDPLYYTVTAIYYDPVQGLEFETPHSQEVVGSPLTLSTNIRDLPGRTQIQIVTDFVSMIQRVDQEISLIPGSTTRDVEIDPFASEAERIWFLVDFVHRSQSFLTLLQIDDANGDGISDAVIASPYKQALKAALGYQTDAAVQTLIDTQFEKLAGNFNKTRLAGRPSVGQVVYYTKTRPTRDALVASGAVVSTDADTVSSSPSVRFVVGGTYTLSATDADAFYNFDTGQYEIVANITAETLGLDGNRPAGQIKNVVSGASNFSVINREATTFGLDRESNYDLALRAQLGFLSVDAGTEGGYSNTAAETIGVVKHKIVKSGDPLMMRDYDDVRRKHIGGKVDLWIRGLRERTISEKFAFSFAIARDIRCQIVDLSTLTLQVLDSRVTIDTPIIQLLDDPSQGLGVRNVTTGNDYDLTGVVILDFQTFQLNTSITQPVTAFGDIITADYRFRNITEYTFALQPVRRVTSVVGQSSGALDIDDGFSLYKTDDPLLTGESTIAKDYLIINQIGGIPTGDTIVVTNESHVLIGFFEEPLLNVGINSTTIKVFNQDRSVEYNGPSVALPDFEIVEGTVRTPIKIVRTASSQIVSGETVMVDYVHDENFTVTYVINDLLQHLQQVVNRRRHVTADVLVKDAIQNQINIDTTVQLKEGANKSSADPAIRTNVSIELNTKAIGKGVAQSDAVRAVDATEGIDFQVLPLARMGYADGSRKIRESVLSTNTRLPTLDIGANQVFILNNPLHYPTIDGGGFVTEHKGVFQDDEVMTLSEVLALVATTVNSAYIIGNDGATILGYSDDATLIAAGFTEPDEILAESLRRTANHIVVALTSGGTPTDNPDQHAYTVSYVVRGDVGPHDITAADVEFVDLGELTLTIREAS